MASISAQSVTLEFPIYDYNQRSLRVSLLRSTVGSNLAVNARNRLAVKALDQISFTFSDGDRVGLVGQNGAGKSALLRTVAGIYQPVSGRVDCEGSMNTLFDISIGFDQDISGRSNIFRRGYFMGLRRAQIGALVSEIAAFSELGPYLDVPMRTYSAGMSLRLAFAISTSVRSDILLMDEWIGVGDASFLKKAEARLLSLTQQSKILMLASHSEALLRDVCNKGLFLHRGRLMAYGDIDTVLDAYHGLDQQAPAVL
jgi:ABC-2 type transport system ATP-binding protein/lipopolysaccharide transport system ATP-binding protein